MPGSFALRAVSVVSTLLASVTMLVAVTSNEARAQEDGAPPPDKLYELRFYTTHEGRLPDLHARFREHTMRLFEKHGMENIIYWTVSEAAEGDDPENMLVYILAHKDRDAAEASWHAFRNDPEWQEVRRKSEENGPILAKPPVSIYMKPTDFSPPDEPPSGETDSTPRLFELRQYNTGEAGLPETVDRFRAGEAELFTRHGMTTVKFWTATDNSAFIYLLAHKDRETSRASWKGFFGDFREFMREYNASRASREDADRDGGRGGQRRTARFEIRFLVPTDYSPRK